MDSEAALLSAMDLLVASDADSLSLSDVLVDLEASTEVDVDSEALIEVLVDSEAALLSAMDLLVASDTDPLSLNEPLSNADVDSDSLADSTSDVL